MTYYKFRGRGPGPEEKAIGADGIFEIIVENQNDGQILTKGLVFQAKKHTNRKTAELDEQIRRMEDLAKNASAVVEFGPEGFFGWSGCSVLNRRGRRTRDDGREGLGDFLAGSFLPCGVGVRGLYFDAKRQILIVPHETRGVIAARARIESRFRIEVEKH